MGEVSFDVSVANRFISSLSKSLQALCHGCMDFDSGIEIIGYINVNIDSGSNVDYVLNEKVQKSRDNSMTFVSNSFLAKKDKTKQLRDGVCSPVPELQETYSYSSQAGSYNQNAYPPFYQSQVLRGAHKRQWSGREREWRASQRKYMRTSQTATRQAFNNNPTHHSSSIPFPTSQSTNIPGASSQSELPGESSFNNTSDSINVKKEAIDNDGQQAETGNLESGDQCNSDDVNVKRDPDSKAQIENKGGPPGDQSLSDNFLQHTTDNTQQSSFPDGSEAGDQGQFDNQQNDPTNTNVNYSESESTQGYDQSYDNTAGDNSDLTVSFGEASGDMSSYPQTSFGDQGETSGGGANFECIEIDDDEEEEFQAIFGDNRKYFFLYLFGNLLVTWCRTITIY